MKLLDLEVESFLGLPDGRYAFTHPATGQPLPLVFIGGGPASGKTSLLEAIIALKESVGSYHIPPDPARFLRSGTTTGWVRGTWQLNAQEASLAGLEQRTYPAELLLGASRSRAPAPGPEAVFKAYVRDPAVGKLEYFPCDRRLEPRLAQAPLNDRAAAELRLTRRGDKYAGFDHVFMRLAARDGLSALAQVDVDGILLKGDHHDSLLPYRAAIRSLCPTLNLSHVELREGGGMVWFERANGAMVDLYHLSHSEQQAVLFAVTHQLFGLSHSILLIDEPELHLHPSEHERLVGGLVGLGQDSQIIAATSSSGLLHSAARHQVIELGAKHH